MGVKDPLVVLDQIPVVVPPITMPPSDASVLLAQTVMSAPARAFGAGVSTIRTVSLSVIQLLKLFDETSIRSTKPAAVYTPDSWTEEPGTQGNPHSGC